MNKNDFILKTKKILCDTTKFEKIGLSYDFDNTAKVESKIQRQLLQLKKDGLLPPSVYKAIRPMGSRRLRLYELSKTHKDDSPLRPILSMIGSSQHSLAKWLTSILDPVLLLYSSNCIQCSFTFAQIIKQCDSPPFAFLCSFDISSLLTNLPLAETINICADAFHSSDLIALSFPRKDFIKLMETANKSVEFSFNNVMYRQIDGVAVTSPLGPVLANIYVDYYKFLLFRRVKKLPMYYRCLDNTFAVFDSEHDCDEFLHQLNSLHPSWRFTFKTEDNQSLPFLDI